MPGLRVLRFLPILFLCVAAGLVPADEEIVREFKRYFKKYKETATRVEAIVSLEDVESKDVVDVLVPILKDPDPEVVEAAVRILGGFEQAGPIAALFAKLAKQKNEVVRVGLLRVLTVGGYVTRLDPEAREEDEEAAEAVLECLTDKSWDVRRRVVQALAATGDIRYEEQILPLCLDREVSVRCAALEGLTSLRSDLVREPAVRALEDPAWQVRASAIAALGTVRHRDSIEPLIRCMKVEEGRLREDVAQALENLTARALGQRLELWERFWGNYADTYQIPTDEELRVLRKKQAARKQEYRPTGTVSYHGIDTPSRSILFVIDISGSMETEVIERELFEEGGYPSFQRIDIVKTELARTVENLEPFVKFNVLAFASETRAWKKRLVTANVLNKSSAADWARRLEPLGGASKSGLANAGLAGLADIEAGRTNTYGALAWALGIEEEAGRDDDYEMDLDTIFFLSDGRPTFGPYTDIDDILREVREANELRKIVIHTIALGEFQKAFMKRLAEENGGVFVDLGR